MAQEFIAHLEELRKRSMLSLIAFFAAAIASYFYSRPLIEFIIAPLKKYQNAELIFQTPYEAFLVHIKVAAVSGLFFSSPVLFAQFWLFVSPGLYSAEKKFLLPLIFLSIILFLVGSVFAYYLVLPAGLHFLLSFQTESLQPFLSISPYFSFAFGTILSCGIIFDFPIMLMGLIKLGVVRLETLQSSRKIIIVLIFVLAAILTPSPDPVTQLFLAIPLLALFELSVIMSRLSSKKTK